MIDFVITFRSVSAIVKVSIRSVDNNVTSHNHKTLKSMSNEIYCTFQTTVKVVKKSSSYISFVWIYFSDEKLKNNERIIILVAFCERLPRYILTRTF